MALILTPLLAVASPITVKAPIHPSEGFSFLEGNVSPYTVKTETFAVLDDDLLLRIIECESGGNPKAKNPNSTARGLLQIIKSSEEFCEEGLGLELDMYSPEDNLLCGRYLVGHGGLAHWQTSESCWR